MRELTWELACGKPPIEGMQLEKAEVFYHNDQEFGFAMSLGHPADIDLEAMLHRAFDEYKRAWDEASEQRREEVLCIYLAQVEDAAREPRGTHTPIAVVLLMNMIWLVAYGEVPQNEYNGTQFVWANGPVVWPSQDLQQKGVRDDESN